MLTEAIVIMAHTLNLNAIAEGVETTEQREFPQAFGCDYVQDFLHSRSIPAKEFEKLIAE